MYLVLLMPLLVLSGGFETFFPFIVGKALYGRAMIEIVFALWLILIYRHPEHRPGWSRVLVAFAIYVLIAVLAGALGVSWQRSLWSTYERMQGIVDLSHWLAFVVVVASAFRSWAHWRYLLNFNLAVSLVVGILGLAQYFDANVPGYRFLHGAPRLDITLGNATFVGAFMLVNILVALGFLARSFVGEPSPQATRPAERRRRRRRARGGHQVSAVVYWRAFWIVVIGLDFAMLWLGATRGGLLGLAAGLAAAAVGYGLLGKLPRVRRVALSGFGLLVVLALLYGITASTGALERVGSSNLTLRRIATVGPEDLSIKGRITSLSAGLQGFLDRPILGWGPENYGVAWARYFDAQAGITETFDQAHNKPVEELTTKGILGFLSYAAIWVVMGMVVVRRFREHDPGQQLFTLFIGAALAGYFVQNLFLFDTPATGLQFYLVMGYVVYLELAGREYEVEPAGERRRATEARVESPWKKPLPAYGLVALVIVAATGVYFGWRANYETFSAARETARTYNSSITWEQRFEYFRGAIDGFQPLANYPRQLLLDQVAANWNGLTEDQASQALEMARGEALKIFESEPQGWRGPVKLTNMYLAAAGSHPELLPAAKFYLAQSRLVAPGTLEVALLKRELERVESLLREVGGADEAK